MAPAGWGSRTVARLSLAAALAAALPVHGAVTIDSNTFGGLEARAIGPAVMSGRVSAIDGVPGVPGKPLTLWVGAASGGVWKSTDGGATFEPVFDEHTQSIGAIAVDPSNPDIVWVGTGEANTRNSVSIGDGIYKTTDGGDSWTRVGLADSERIARIRIDPSEPNTVFVCATGKLWGPGEERGVYKTTDGGDTWTQVLAVDDTTGCADLDIDPQDPSVLYAAMWQFRRSPDFFESGGPGSGLHRSTDGGETWTELTEGLPKGTKGRIAIGVAPSRPSTVYTTVESETTGLYRSDDLGSHWRLVNSGLAVGMRPFYFAELVVDPLDHQRLYKPGLGFARSVDGGESFSNLLSGGFSGTVHVDHHALWINPENPNEQFLGTDGGLYRSHDRGSHWLFVRNLPLAQFYRVSFDMDTPFNVYGGLQDNGSWAGPSSSAAGIQNKDWLSIGGGDGFYVFRDPADPDYVYQESQGGNINRRRLSTGETRDVRPFPKEGEEPYRFNWNAPIHLSRLHPGRVYLGSQVLLRTDDHGVSWQSISPDLTTDDPARQRQMQSGGISIDNSTAENNTTIYAISESPITEGVIWAGSDDGKVQVSRNDGETWTDVTENLPGLPAGLWVSGIEAGHHDDQVAYVTVDGHRSSDMAPYVFRTSDSGATWTSLVTDNLEGYALDIAEDPVNPDLLFLGTEWGLWISLDGGTGWARFTGNMPKRVAVREIAIHPRDRALIVATHGRGIYILDDLTPLRELRSETLDQEVAILGSRPAIMTTFGFEFDFGGDGEFRGANPPEAAQIHYYLKKRHLFGDLKVEILDSDGELITTLPAPKRRGINAVSWPMRLPPPKLPAATNLAQVFQGPLVLEGTYRYRLTKGEQVLEGTVELVPDPRSPHSREDRLVQQQTALDLYTSLDTLTYIVEAISEARDGLRQRAEDESTSGRLERDLGDLADRYEEERGSLVSTSEAGWLSGDEKLREQYGRLFGVLNSYTGRPTQTQLDQLEALNTELETAVGRFDGLAEELDALNRTLERKGLEPVTLLSKDVWQERQNS